MRLYQNPASPFGRKVEVFLAELGLDDRVERIPAAGHPTDPGTMPVAHNPLGKLPTLVREDGPALYDSRVICRYLDALADGGLYPSPPRLWDTLVLEATADGIMDAAVLMVYEARSRPEAKRYDDWVEGQWSKVLRALDVLEGRWMAHLHGRLDAGQVAVGCALGYLDFRHSDRDWRGDRPSLAAWFAAFAERPSMAGSRPDMA